MFAAKTVNFELFSTFPFFASALILPRTDHFKLLVCISVRGSWSISFHFFPFQVTYCSCRWFAILGPFPAATIDFSHPFPTCLESVPRLNCFSPESILSFQIYVIILQLLHPYFSAIQPFAKFQRRNNSCKKKQFTFQGIFSGFRRIPGML